MDDLDSNFPQLIFGKLTLALLTFLNLLEQVSIIGIFHDDTQIWTMLAVRRLVNECFIILDYVWVIFDTCEDSDFVDWIFTFFVAQTFDNPHLFERINEAIKLSDYLIDCWITAFSQLLKDLEITQVAPSELWFDVGRRLRWNLLRMALLIPRMIKIRQVVVNWPLFHEQLIVEAAFIAMYSNGVAVIVIDGIEYRLLLCQFRSILIP